VRRVAKPVALQTLIKSVSEALAEVDAKAL
jgi:hypothetical protein